MSILFDTHFNSLMIFCLFYFGSYIVISYIGFKTDNITVVYDYILSVFIVMFGKVITWIYIYVYQEIICYLLPFLNMEVPLITEEITFVLITYILIRLTIEWVNKD